MGEANKEMNQNEETPDAGLGKVSARIEELARERPSHKEILAFLKELVTEQYRIKPEIETHPVPIDEALIQKKTAEGFPLVDKGALKLDMVSATTLFKALCKVLKRNSKVSKDVEKIEQLISGQELNLEELFQKTAAGNGEYIASQSDRLDLKAGILSFLAENSLRPNFEAYARELKGHVDQERWWRAYCPICGSEPVMAELVGRERKRFLICSCCGYEWRFKRIQCPFCENEERRKFKYFFAEEEDRAYRVETCQKCKKYIKTVDTEALYDAFIPLVEDVGTLYLDVLAKKEGYTRGVHPFGLNLADL
jgi:FdhE protein